jgi:hypothetical protein
MMTVRVEVEVRPWLSVTGENSDAYAMPFSSYWASLGRKRPRFSESSLKR